jgi:hypothetical protein
MALGVFIVVCALLFLLRRRRRRSTIVLGSAGAAMGRREPVPAEPWTRSDRIALASLVVGAVLGLLGLLAR